MKFKEDAMRVEFGSAHTFLTPIATRFEYWSLKIAGVEPVITRVFGKIEGDSGVHKDGLAFDARDESDGKRLYTDTQVKAILDRINLEFPRFDGKLTGIHHSFKGGPLHFHFQVARNPLAYKEPEKPTEG